jgi:nucleoside-diphosphate-sugar epimerase
MKALVTGATSYVGSKLCERLLADGWQVEAIIRAAGRPLPEPLANKVQLHSYDGSTQSLIDAVATSAPDFVFHLASLFIAEHRSEQVTDLINSNVLFGTQLIEACARAGVKRFINTGTSWQHYRSDAYDPVCLYAATKQAFEGIMDYYCSSESLHATTLHLYDTYGPADPRSKVLNLLIDAAKTGRHLDMSPGEQLVDLVHIDDVVSAFVLAAIAQPNSADAVHRKFSVCSRKPLSIQSLVGEIGLAAGKPINVSFGACPYRKREVMQPLYVHPDVPNWKPRLDLRTGLKSLLGATHG